MNLKECYSAAGANYEDVMRRFVSEERVERFLKMFLRDQNFNILCSAMDKGDFDSAFQAVHTIKGICMNLSLSALLDSCVELTENLRSGKPNQNTELCFEKTKENYLKTIESIQNYLN